MQCQGGWRNVTGMSTGQNTADRTAATAQATHRISWGAETEEVDGMLISHCGYETRDYETGDVTDFVRVSEWATAAESRIELRNAGYEPLGFSLVRKAATATAA